VHSITAALAREGDQDVMPAIGAAGTGEAVGEDAAFQVTAELAFHIGRHALAIPVVFP
jgi:hypothetical protein